MILSKVAIGATALMLAIATVGPACAKPAIGRDIATTILADPHYVMATKGHTRRRGYQAERPVANGSNFLPIVSAVVAAATGVTLASQGVAASH